MKKAQILLSSIFIINIMLSIVLLVYDLYPNDLLYTLDLTEMIITNLIILYLILQEKE